MSMTRIDEVPHFRSLFRQLRGDWHGTSELLEVIRVKARAFIGERPGWNLSERDGPTGTFAFLLFVRGERGPQSVINAALVLDTCTEALLEGRLPDRAAGWIADAWGGMDTDHAKAGKPVTEGREKGRNTSKAVASNRHNAWQESANRRFIEDSSQSLSKVARDIAAEWNKSNPSDPAKA